MCLPTGISILMENLPEAKHRNLALGWLGVGYPFGYQVGLVVGGATESTGPGWRLGFYICGGLTLGFLCLDTILLPPDQIKGPVTWKGLYRSIDVVGIYIASSGLGVFSYICT